MRLERPYSTSRTSPRESTVEQASARMLSCAPQTQAGVAELVDATDLDNLSA
ncbi:MAG: hypothetical protein MSG64_02675 [Pyrinomonadaceae bacterium MAG19_C2-C3]|nr:hypothetical protein [Pyrinomonadaceae bacterium MAG19_C2-C3]